MGVLSMWLVCNKKVNHVPCPLVSGPSPRNSPPVFGGLVNSSLMNQPLKIRQLTHG